MSDNWNPPPGRDPSEPEGDQPAGGETKPGPGGQSPRWWTDSAEKPQEYLRPGPPAPQGPTTPGQPSPTQPLPPASATPGGSQPYGGGPERPRGQHAAPPPSASWYGAGQAGSGPANSGPANSGPANSGPAGSGPAGSGGSGSAAGPTSSWPSSSTGPIVPPPSTSWPAGPTNQPPQSNPWSGAAPSGGYPAYQQQGGWQQPQAGQYGGSQGGQYGGPQGGQPGGQPSWQYPPIPIPQPPGGGRRRKQRRTSKGLLIGLVVLAVLAVASGVTYAVRNGGDDDQTPVAVDTPTETPSETPTVTPTPTPSVTPKPKPPAKPKPKPKPKPRQPTAYELVAKNKLYSAGALQPTKCVEPPYRPTTFPATKAYYHRLLPCLNRTWWLAMKKAGLPFRPPNLIVYANQVKTPCGTERGTRGFYCSANEAIYMPFNVDYKNYKINPMYTRAWMLNTFAHEYGHHIQQLSGIFGASFARAATMADPNLRLLESRKRELQASCLGSAYLGANAAYIPMRGALLDAWKFAVANAGDEFSRPRVRDHGSKANHNLWSTRGFTYKNPVFCNTFSTKPQWTS